MALTLAVLLGTGTPALAQEDLQHFSTPGWYRYIVWHSEDGQEEWDRYIEAGPFADKAACEATMRGGDENNTQYCEYFETDPEA